MGSLLFSAIFVVFLDQATKLFILAHVSEGQPVSVGWVVIRRVANEMRGRFFLNRPTLLVLWITEVSIVLVLVVFEPSFQSAFTQAALGAVLGGVTGNMIDRVWRAGVVDFVDFGFWPVFNLADLLIVGGVLLIALSMWH